MQNHTYSALMSRSENAFDGKHMQNMGFSLRLKTESVTFIASKIGFMTTIKLKHLSSWGTSVSSGVAYLLAQLVTSKVLSS